MSVKAVIFDLDDTLADPAKPMSDETRACLCELEQRGVRIAVCSGKPTHYLCGFLRMSGLQAPILIGENGCVIQEYVDLPPRRFFVLPYDHRVQKLFRQLKDEIDEAIPDMWYQPNVVNFTPFPKNDAEFETVAEILGRHDLEEQVEVYRHYDCFDLVPKGLNKAEGLRCFGELFQIKPEEMVAVGNGANDYPMFAFAGMSLGVKVPEAERVNRNFSNVEEVMKYLLEEICL